MGIEQLINGAEGGTAGLIGALLVRGVGWMRDRKKAQRAEKINGVIHDIDILHRRYSPETTDAENFAGQVRFVLEKNFQ